MPLVPISITLMVQRHKAGEQILAGGVFAGFQQNAGQQMGVDLLALLYLGLLALGLFLLRSSWPEAFAHSGGRIKLGLSTLFLALPLVSACFFAPALVALSGESAMGAMGKSLMASLRNWALFLNLGFYGLTPVGARGRAPRSDAGRVPLPARPQRPRRRSRRE